MFVSKLGDRMLVFFLSVCLFEFKLHKNWTTASICQNYTTPTIRIY